MQAKIHNFNGWVAETRPDYLMCKYRGALKAAGFTVLHECTHFFEPYGFTALFLLGESHFAIHTFPEHSKTYIELSSCVDAPFYKFLDMCAGDMISKE